MNILVPNLGSTSLKYKLIEFPSERTLAAGKSERIGRPDGDAPSYREAVERALAECGQVDAVGFKAVHAGPQFRGVHPVDDSLMEALRRFEPAAPLHNHIYLSGILLFRELRPELPLYAALETAFHRTMPAYASAYGLPRAWRDEHGVARYGFHGASHRYVSERAPALLGRDSHRLRLVSCHLGGSSSICAVRDGQSLDTTMGFSPQSGLENATRHGDVDPFAVLYLMERMNWKTARMRQELLASGGLAGLSGVPGGDVRDIRQASAEGSADARLALDAFCYQIRKTIGGYAAALGGLDVVAFTGGIGENAPEIRAQACEGLDFLGVRIDPERNRASGDRRISPDGAPVDIAVLRTNEELIVARETARAHAAA